MAWFSDNAKAAPAQPSVASPKPTATEGAQCSECGQPSALHRCSRCGVPYCSPDCQRKAWKGHKAVCQRVPTGGASASLDLRSELTGHLQPGWQQYFKERGVVRKTEMERIKESEAFALAALQALLGSPPDMPLEATNGRCVVWVLGARDGIEKRQILLGGWEPLFAAINVAWDVVLVGPEMQKDTNTRVAPGRRIYTYACLTHEANMHEHLKRPTFICALNTGVGANVVHHMRSWVPTLQELLVLGRPVLFTCFGLHEAKVEAQIFQALHARFAPHREGGFSYVLEPDKPLSVCNAMFTWVHGTKLPLEQLERQAVPYIDAQLHSAELFHFLKEARSHVNIISDPEGASHSGWAEMYDGRFVPCLKKALEEDDDDRGGIQTIVRCTMKTLASASRSPAAAAVLVHMGVGAALGSFRQWVESGHWTRHDWIREEVTGRVGELELLLQGVNGSAAVADADLNDAEEPFFSSFCVRADTVELHSQPAFTAPVLAKVSFGRVLHTRAHRGLWLLAGHRGVEGWLMGYQNGGNVGDMTSWDIVGWAAP